MQKPINSILPQPLLPLVSFLHGAIPFKGQIHSVFLKLLMVMVFYHRKHQLLLVAATIPIWYQIPYISSISSLADGQTGHFPVWLPYIPSLRTQHEFSLLILSLCWKADQLGHKATMHFNLQRNLWTDSFSGHMILYSCQKQKKTHSSTHWHSLAIFPLL